MAKILYFLYTVWFYFLAAVGNIIALVIGLPLLPFDAYIFPKLGHYWGKYLIACCFIRIEVEGLENINPSGSYVFIANHQSYLDIISLLAVLPQRLIWMAKKELFSIPIFGWTLTKAKFIPIDRANPRSITYIKTAIRRLEDGCSITVFPEGTRTRDGSMLPFKKGSLLLAYKARKNVVPMVISGSMNILSKNSILMRPGTIRISIFKPVTLPENAADGERMLDEIRTDMVSKLETLSSSVFCREA